MERKNQNEENENGDIISCQCIIDGSMTACGTTNTGMNAADQGNNNTTDQGADTKVDKDGDGIIDDAVNDVTEGIDDAVDDMTDNGATDKGTVR